MSKKNKKEHPEYPAKPKLDWVLCCTSAPYPQRAEFRTYYGPGSEPGVMTFVRRQGAEKYTSDQAEKLIRKLDEQLDIRYGWYAVKL